MDWMDQNEPL